MKSHYISEENTQLLNDIVNSIANDEGVKSVLVFLAEDSVKDFANKLSLFKENDITIIGGVFPALIVEGKRNNNGMLAIPLPFELKVERFDLKGKDDSIMDDLIQSQQHSLSPNSTLFVFFDALSSQKSVFTDTLFNFFGINTTYIGGGAGSLSFVPQPCIIDSEGIHQDCALIGWSNVSIDIGSAHGWESISDPLKITKAQNNNILSLNWEPAFDVYKKVIFEHSGAEISEEHFFDIAKSYPLGIKKLDAEVVVRDPFKSVKSGIQFFDSIDEGEFVQVLHGNLDSLLRGAQQAKELARKSKLNDCGCLVIDCISRALFLGDNFQLEMDAIQCSTDLNGVLSIGELANSGESYLEIFNKTIVIGIW